jgi:hypothetical protein
MSSIRLRYNFLIKLLLAGYFNDYANEDIPDEEALVPPSSSSRPPQDELDSLLCRDGPMVTQDDHQDDTFGRDSPSPCPSQIDDTVPLPRKPARFGRRSSPPMNVPQLMRLAGGLGFAAALSTADAYTDPLGPDWEVPSARSGGESRRAGNKRKAANITRSAAEDFALLTTRTTSEHHAADFLSTVTNVSDHIT